MILWPKFRSILGIHRRIQKIKKTRMGAVVLHRRKKIKKTKRGAVAVDERLSDLSEPVFLHRKKKIKKTKRGAVEVEEKLSDLSEQVVLHRRKKRKKNRGKSDVTVEDIPEVPIDALSNLPDAIIRIILSCLDMKEVLLMSILSTKWRYVWTSVSFLNFNFLMWEQNMQKKNRTVATDLCKEKFTGFVSNVLRLRDNEYPIVKFNVSCGSYYISSRIKTWIMVLLKRNVEEFNLEIDAGEALELPSNLFSSPSLKVFTLQGKSFIVDVRLPNSICYADHLKTLKLVSVALPLGDLDGELLLSCPVLEDLAIVDCELRHLQILSLSALDLKNLYLKFDQGKGIDSCLIRICAPSLTSFEYHGCLYECSGQKFFSLVSASIDSCRYDHVNAHSMINLLKEFCNAKTLTLSAGPLQASSESLDIFERFPELFGNLKYLKVTKWFNNLCLGTLGELLESAPYLDTFVLEIEEDFRKENDEGGNWEALSPDCFIHLKSAAIRNLHGCNNELKFLKVLLKNAKVLEKLTITLVKNQAITKEVLATFQEKLQLLPKASEGAAIVFV